MQADATDAALIVRVLSGDVGAYTPLVHRHYEPCARYARRMLGNAQDAEDVLQETFLRAYTALVRYQERDRFRSWLFSILVNECRSLARRRTRRARYIVPESPEDSEPQVAAREDGVRDALQIALDGLDETHREALVLKYGEELEYEEMSRVTGASVSALKMRVKRAREAVRPVLEELLHE